LDKADNRIFVNGETVTLRGFVSSSGHLRMCEVVAVAAEKPLNITIKELCKDPSRYCDATLVQLAFKVDFVQRKDLGFRVDSHNIYAYPMGEGDWMISCRFTTKTPMELEKIAQQLKMGVEVLIKGRVVSAEKNWIHMVKCEIIK